MFLFRCCIRVGCGNGNNDGEHDASAISLAESERYRSTESQLQCRLLPPQSAMTTTNYGRRIADYSGCSYNVTTPPLFAMPSTVIANYDEESCDHVALLHPLEQTDSNTDIVINRSTSMQASLDNVNCNDNFSDNHAVVNGLNNEIPVAPCGNSSQYFVRQATNESKSEGEDEEERSSLDDYDEAGDETSAEVKYVADIRQFHESCTSGSSDHVCPCSACWPIPSNVVNVSKSISVESQELPTVCHSQYYDISLSLSADSGRNRQVESSLNESASSSLGVAWSVTDDFTNSSPLSSTLESMKGLCVEDDRCAQSSSFDSGVFGGMLMVTGSSLSHDIKPGSDSLTCHTETSNPCFNAPPENVVPLNIERDASLENFPSDVNITSILHDLIQGVCKDHSHESLSSLRPDIVPLGHGTEDIFVSCEPDVLSMETGAADGCDSPTHFIEHCVVATETSCTDADESTSAIGTLISQNPVAIVASSVSVNTTNALKSSCDTCHASEVDTARVSSASLSPSSSLSYFVHNKTEPNTAELVPNESNFILAASTDNDTTCDAAAADDDDSELPDFLQETDSYDVQSIGNDGIQGLSNVELKDIDFGIIYKDPFLDLEHSPTELMPSSDQEAELADRVTCLNSRQLAHADELTFTQPVVRDAGYEVEDAFDRKESVEVPPNSSFDEPQDACDLQNVDEPGNTALSENVDINSDFEQGCPADLNATITTIDEKTLDEGVVEVNGADEKLTVSATDDLEKDSGVESHSQLEVAPEQGGECEIVGSFFDIDWYVKDIIDLAVSVTAGEAVDTDADVAVPPCDTQNSTNGMKSECDLISESAVGDAAEVSDGDLPSIVTDLESPVDEAKPIRTQRPRLANLDPSFTLCVCKDGSMSDSMDEDRCEICRKENEFTTSVDARPHLSQEELGKEITTVEKNDNSEPLLDSDDVFVSTLDASSHESTNMPAVIISSCENVTSECSIRRQPSDPLPLEQEKYKRPALSHGVVRSKSWPEPVQDVTDAAERLRSPSGLVEDFFNRYVVQVQDSDRESSQFEVQNEDDVDTGVQTGEVTSDKPLFYTESVYADEFSDTNVADPDAKHQQQHMLSVSLHSSPPLSPTSSLLKCHSAPHHRKKSVHFADAVGLELASVRHFQDTPDEPPASLEEFLRKLAATADRRTRWTEQHPRHTTAWPTDNQTSLCLCSELAVNTTIDLTELVLRSKVVLESCCCDDFFMTVSGVVRVANMAFNKTVFVRYTIDGWSTETDLDCQYVPLSNDGTTDRFGFTIILPSKKTFTVGSRLELAICYTVVCDDAVPQTFWDNNSGSNYIVEFRSLSSSIDAAATRDDEDDEE